MAAARSAVERRTESATSATQALAVDPIQRLVMTDTMVAPLLGLVEDKSLLAE